MFLSELIHPHGGGAEFATYLWAKLLADSGLHIKVLTNRMPNELEETACNNLTIYRVPLLTGHASMKYSLLRGTGILLSSFFRKLMLWADVVYIPRYFYSAIPVVKSYGKPVIIHLHDYIPVCPLATLYNPFRNENCKSHGICHPNCIVTHERTYDRDILKTSESSILNLAVWPYFGKLLNLSDVVIFVSRAQRDALIANMPSLMPKCHVIYNPMPKYSEDIIEGDDMGYFGGPDPLKGFNVLCSALKCVKNKVTVHATGFTPSTRRFIGSSSCSRIVYYDRLPEDRYKSVYKQIRTVLVPSIWSEPAPYVVAEAMLQGRLIIASEVGGIPEQVNNCPGAFLFEPGNYEELKNQIDYIANLDNQTKTDMGTKNRESFSKGFDNERILQTFISMLDEIIN